MFSLEPFPRGFEPLANTFPQILLPLLKGGFFGDFSYLAWQM